MLAYLLIYLTLLERIFGRTHCLHFIVLTFFDALDMSESLSTMFLKRLHHKNRMHGRGEKLSEVGLNDRERKMPHTSF